MVNPIEILFESVMSLLKYAQSLWNWLSNPVELNINLGFIKLELFSITPIYLISGVGLTALIIWWIIRG